jgi:hypothetical protein
MSDQPFDELLSDDEIATIVRKVGKARDNFAKMDVLSEYVDWGRREELLWWLVAEGHLAAAEDPYLWSKLAENYADYGTPGTVADLLAAVEEYDVWEKPESDPHGGGRGGDPFYDEAMMAPEQEDPDPHWSSQRLVDFWPIHLDKLAVRAYADDADALLDRADDFSDEVQKGFKLVQRRFGDIEVDALPDDIIDTLATEHIEGTGLPNRILMVEDGEVVEADYSDYNGDPEGLYDFIELHGSRQAWNEAVLEHALDHGYGASFSKANDGWRIASNDQLSTLLGNVSAHGQQAIDILDFLSEELERAPEELADIAATLLEEEEKQFAEICTIAAIRRAEALDEPAPEGVEEAISFQSLGNPTKRDKFVQLAPLVDALTYLGEERARPRFEACFEADYYRTKPIAALKAFPEADDLLDRAIEVFEEVVGDNSNPNFATTRTQGIGFAVIGPAALSRLNEAYEATDKPVFADTYRRAAVYILADLAEAGEDLPEEHVDAISFTEWDPEITDARNFGHYLLDDLKAALGGLDYDDGEALLLDELDADRPLWPRTLAGVPVVPSGEVIDRAFDLAVNEGVPGTKDNFNWFEKMLQGLPEECMIDVGDALAATDDAEFHNAVEKVVGEQKYEELLEQAGGSSAADKSKVDKVARLSKAYFDDNPDAGRTTLFFLERGDGEPDDEAVSRLGGAPYGIDEDEWPCRDEEGDEPFTHMFTIDMNDVPSMKGPFKEEARAVSLFVQNPNHNEAWSAGNDSTIVQVLTEDEVADGPYEGELPVGDESPTAIEAREVEVPTAIFDYDPMDYQNSLPDQLDEIRGTVYQTSAWGGGSPMWLQAPEYAGGLFLLQFDESFAYMNLGDMGIMYVFTDTAFWQCH